MKYKLSNTEKAILLDSIHKEIDTKKTVANRTALSSIVPYLIAASLAFLVTVGIYFLIGDSAHSSFDEKMITWTSSPSQRDTLLLADGTVITTNGSSEILYSESNPRKVMFSKGEALFSVTTTPSKDKFVVSLPNGEIKVLGTIFNVKYNETTAENTVSLLEGKVILTSTTGESSYLNVENTAKLSKEGHVKLIESQYPFEVAWIKGYYEFDNIPLSEIIYHLGFDNELSNLSTHVLEKKVSGRFPVQEKPQNILKAISQIYNIKITFVQE